MKILQDWNDELKDTETTAFKALSARLETEVKTILTIDFLKVFRLVFWSGVVGPGTNFRHE